MANIDSRIEAEVRLARTSDDPVLTAFHLGKAAGLAEARAGQVNRAMRHAFDDYVSGYCQGVAEFLKQGE